MRYDFSFEPVSVYACAVDLIVAHSKPGGVHLDLGCGEGAIYEKVKQAGLTYIGIDASEDSVRNLKARGIEAYVLNLDDSAEAIALLIDLCAGRRVASISMLDVLEHLPHDQTLLLKLGEWAKTFSSPPPLVVSVPNFSHLDVAAKLLAGRWEYTQSGLLDNTHRTIFTARLLDASMRTNGWEEVAKNDYLLELSDQYSLTPTVLLNREAGIGRHLRSIKELVDPDVGVHQFVRLYKPAEVEAAGTKGDELPLLTIILIGRFSALDLSKSLARLKAQSDQDFTVRLMSPAGADDDLGQYSNWPGRFFETSSISEESLSDIGSRYWTVLDASAELDEHYIARVREAVERHSDQVAIFLDTAPEGEVGHFCVTPAHFAALIADPAPNILLPAAYITEFRDSPPRLFEDITAWREFLLRVACRAGIWHESAVELSLRTTCLSRFGHVPGFGAQLSRVASSVWPRANELAAVMAAEATMQNEELTTRNAELRAELIRMQQTLSWKLSSPLRIANHLAHGRVSLARSMAFGIVRAAFSRFPLRGRMFFRSLRTRVHRLREIADYSPQNAPAMANMVRYRCDETDRIAASVTKMLSAEQLPAIDVSVVTYNSEKWVHRFAESLLEIDYPRELLKVTFVDNSSTDDTVIKLEKHIERLKEFGIQSEILLRPNLGFGAGHNAGIANGTAPFCLVTNLDLEFDRDALSIIARRAQSDEGNIASWEFRQKPYEHPKYYDPVTGITNWSSHACVLLRRTAFESVKGYDQNLFMYGEDVELSYRLRREGYILKYCPDAVVYHYTYETAGQVKPLQYTGSISANFYLRLKYGALYDVLMIPVLAIAVLAADPPFPGSRSQLLRKLGGVARMTPNILKNRSGSDAAFPFRGLDYDVIRRGAFTEACPAYPAPAKLVTVITRTYRGRETYLKQALLSVINQSYPNIEMVVVEDGGETMRSVVESFEGVLGRQMKFIPLEKVGRSAAGNAGLKAASGDLIVFLDDDDLLFADHLELLAWTLDQHPDAVAAYSPAMELSTDSEEIAAGRYLEKSIFTPPALVGSFCFETLRVKNCMAIQSVMFYRELFTQRGGFEEDMDALEDWNLWCRYAAGNRFVYVDKVTSMYRVPSDAARKASRQKALDGSYDLARKRLKLIEAEYLY